MIALILFSAVSIAIFYICFLFGNLKAQQPACVTIPPSPVAPSVSSVGTQKLPPCPSTPVQPVQQQQRSSRCSTTHEPSGHELFFNKRPAEKKTAADYLFSKIFHPGASAKEDILIAKEKFEPHSGVDQFNNCKEVYLTRTGARTNQSPKCLAVAHIKEGDQSPYLQSHRIGVQGKFENQYMRDYSKDFGDESLLMKPMFDTPGLKELQASLRELLGNPILEDGVTRRAITVMVANDGVMDLILNLFCSLKSAGINLDGFVVFVGQPDHVDLVNSMGAHGVYSEVLGSMPKSAAGYYGDRIFSRMMWLKVSTVYITASLGYDVLFQDADLVWFKDPIPYLRSLPNDIIFMDDGARTPRYTPYFMNSGFYYMKYNAKTQYFMERLLKSVTEIATTHSHQTTMIRYIIEVHDLVGLDIVMVSQQQFPSGYMYHHAKKYIKDMIDYKVVPYVFHMCWTSSREDKVTYFQEIGMWYLPKDSKKDTCELAPKMMEHIRKSDVPISELCCVNGNYYKNMPVEHKSLGT